MYLQSDGITFLLLVGWPLAFLTAIVTLVLSGFERDPLLKLYMWSVCSMVYVVMVAAGTRIAIVFPAVAALVLIGNVIRARRINVVSLAAAVVLLALAAFTFSVVYAARIAPHGLLNLPELIRAVVGRDTNFAGLLLSPVKQLVASVVVSHIRSPSAQRNPTFWTSF